MVRRIVSFSNRIHADRSEPKRSVYLKSDGPQFWDSVDGKLKTIREIAHARHPEDPVSAKKAIHT
jgi:hypothetical protein